MQKAGFLTTRLKYYDSVLNVFFREVGIIAGSVVGVVVLFGIAVSLISCCCCHSNERRGYVKVNEGNMITFCERVLGKLLHQGTSTHI